jgi:potassium voltage-gated channel Eag-related subfamily H protein 7
MSPLPRTVTPWEVGFQGPPKTGLEPMFIINRFIDSIFLVDMCLQFRLMYQVDATSTDGARWEDDPRAIARHYLCTWFGLDLLSILPFDVLSIVAGDQLAKLKVIRLFRLLRLIKLIRLLRASRMFKRWETRMAIDYGTLALVRSMVLVCVGAHWFACAWAIQTGFFDSPLETWMGEQGYCVPADNEEGYACVPPWDMYSASIYFAMMSITSIGYGDISATPQNAAEQGVATVLMLLGGMLWSNVVATFCGVIATANPDTTEFRATMDALNRFMSSQQIPPEMQRRLREYFHQSKHLQDTINRRNLLEKMSPQLAGEVALTCNEKWLNKVWFLRGAGQEFVVQIALQLQAMVFTIGEVVSNGFLYIIHRGIALYGGRVLTAGSVWGEDMLLESQWLVGKHCARAMTYLEVYTIGREQIMEAAAHFPGTIQHLRRCAVRLALRREFIRVASLIKDKNKYAGGSSRNTMVRTKTRGRGSSTFDRLLDLASFETQGPLLGAVHQPEADRVHFSAPSIGHSPVATRPSDESPNSSFKKGSPVPRAASSEFFDVEAEGTAPSGWSDSVRGAALLDEQALAAQLARLEKRLQKRQDEMGKQMEEQFASLRSGMEMLLDRLSGDNDKNKPGKGGKGVGFLNMEC